MNIQEHSALSLHGFSTFNPDRPADEIERRAAGITEQDERTPLEHVSAGFAAVVSWWGRHLGF